MADLFTYRASTVPMPGLVEVTHSTENRWVHLYCWPCKTTHEFGLKDVEKIVYALSAADAHCDAWPPNYGTGHFAPGCLMDWLKDERRDAEHVAKSIECRERSDG